MFFAPTAKEDKRKYSAKKSVQVSYDKKGKVLVQEKEREE